MLSTNSLRRLSNICLGPRRQVSRSFTRTITTLALRPNQSQHSAMSMLQKAVDKQSASKSAPFVQQSRQSATITTHKSVLSPLSANNQASNPLAQSNFQTTKRSATGLARTLSANSGFEENMPYVPPVLKSSNPSLASAGNNFFDFEGAQISLDDLDSDWEIEEVKPLPKKIAYPDITSSLPAKTTISKASVVRAGPISSSAPKASIEEVYDWSSSPVINQVPTVSLSKYSYLPESTVEEATKPKRVISKSQKRRLPKEWEVVEEPKRPWDITAGTLKKQLKRIKTTESEDGRAAAIEKKKKSSVARIFLSDEQQHVLNLVVDKGKSVFFTGSAGTGKSVLLREIIAALKRKYSKDTDRVAITASTGLAACNIGGITLHSFSGIGMGDGSVQDLVRKVKRNPKAKAKWMRTKVLIIDEISMVDGDLYDKLEAIARTIRNNGRPFGGIQLVITGDFFQLPPVVKNGKPPRFTFNADCWTTTIEKTIGLHKVFRQKDPEFASMLNQLREGFVDSSTIAKFRGLSRPLTFNDGIEATELFSTRREVEDANRQRLAALDGEMHVFEAFDGGAIKDLEIRTKLLANLMAPERIALKKGAQVMLIKNMDETLVNGSLGKVIGFVTENQFANYQETAPSQVSSTQGGTLVDEELMMQNIKSRKQDSAGAQRLPIVRFAIADGTTRDLFCGREVWQVEQPNGEVSASRSQIPLMLAWALSIHKAQGQTLERVKVNLSRAFEKGQAYVALSRATSMAGLQVIGFDQRKVMTHETVRKFYASLTRFEDKSKKAENEDLEFDNLSYPNLSQLEKVKSIGV